MKCIRLIIALIFLASITACSGSDTGNQNPGDGGGISNDTGNNTDNTTNDNNTNDNNTNDNNTNDNNTNDNNTNDNNTNDNNTNDNNTNDNNTNDNNTNDNNTNDNGSSTISCLPEGLYSTPGQTPDYCSVYDENGREKMGNDHPRRVIGYFTSWRTGKKGKPRYLASDIPWDKVTHINYAFAHIDDNYAISVGDTSNPENPATGMEWPDVSGAEMASGYNYKGHFNLLNKYKKQYPDVKTLIAVGGWAETGGYLDEDGNRISNGGFYSMTTNSDGSVNTSGINTFADSVVTFLRTYGFDGVDIDYEYPTSMMGAGHPSDFSVADPLRGNLMESYVALMKTLREKLDAAGKADSTHYMLTIAAPASSYLLRGMETFQVTQYLDYINIMSYDMHGAWNEFVGHHAPLFDNGKDAELIFWDVYSTQQYGGIGSLNADWAYHYFRGGVQAGRINLGIPYYTRGWKDVTGGDNGLNGTAPFPNQNNCPDGTGGSAKCGNGATGIDNLWHDKDDNGNEMGAGSNPMWHAKNLQNGIDASYMSDYGFDTVKNPDDKIKGTYERHYDTTADAAWLWNEQEKVFLSIEDEDSMKEKLDYVASQGIGGVMFWELAGDYDWDALRNEYYIGSKLTSLAYTTLSDATPYKNKKSDSMTATEAVNITATMTDFKEGDQNYPIAPKLVITNTTGITLSGGTEFQFDMPTSTPDQITDQSGAGLTVISSGDNQSGNNIGGLNNDFHRISCKVPTWQTLASGESFELTINYYLPVAGPTNFTVNIDGTTYAFASEYPEMPVKNMGGSNTGNGGSNTGNGQNCDGIDQSTVSVYPEWPAGDHASGGDLVLYNNQIWKAKWWTNSVPSNTDGSWELVCSN